MNIQKISDRQLLVMKRQHEQRVKRMQEMANDVHDPSLSPQLVDDLLAGTKMIDDEIERRKSSVS